MATQFDWVMKYTLFKQFFDEAYQDHYEFTGSHFQNLSNAAVARLEGIRLKLAELDIRFGEFGPKGIFNIMDAKNLLDHAMVPKEKVSFAMDNPPSDTRAGERGKWIKHLCDEKRAQDMIVNWDRIIDHKNGRWLDFYLPFAKDVTWKTANLRADSYGLL